MPRGQFKKFGARIAVVGGEKFKTDMRGVGDSGTKNLGRIEKGAGALNGVLRKATALATAYVSVASVFDSVRGFATFEQNLVGVGKTTNIAGAALEALGGEVDLLSRRIPVAADHLLTIAQSAGQLGVSGSQNILLFTDTIAKLESASDLVGEKASKSLARILNVTGEATDNIDNLASVIVALGNNMAASESEITNITQQVALGAAQYKIASHEAAGLGAAMAAMGLRAELSGSSVGRALRAIDAAIEGGGAAMQKLSELTGIAADDLKAAFGADRVGTFVKFLQGLRGIDAAGSSVSKTLEVFNLKGEELLKTLPVMALQVNDVEHALKLASAEFKNNAALTREAMQAWDTTASAGRVLMNTIDSLQRGFAQGFNAELKASAREMQGIVEEAIPAAQALGGSFAPAVTAASKGLVLLAENGEVVKGLFAILAARSLGGSKRLAAVGAEIAAQTKLMTTYRARADAEVAATAATLNTAKANQTGAFAANQMALAARRNAQGAEQMAAANALVAGTSRKMVAANAAAVAATNAHTAALGRQGVAARAAAAGMATLRGGLALIGGPGGAALLAAWGLYELFTQETAAEKIAREHNLTMENTARALQGLTKASDDYNRSLTKREELQIRGLRTDIEAAIQREQAFLTGPQGQARFLSATGGRNLKFTENFEGAFEANKILNELQQQYRDGEIGAGLYADGLTELALRYKETESEIMPLLKALDQLEEKMAKLRELDAIGRFGANITPRDKPAVPANDTDPGRGRAAPAAAFDFTAFSQMTDVKPLSQTVAQYDEARQKIRDSLFQMENDSLTAMGNVTQVIRREADAQIAIWKQKAKDGVATEEEMFRAITLINQQAARDAKEFVEAHDVGLQAGKDAARTFTDVLTQAGATGADVLDSLGRSFKTTMLKMVSDAFLLKPIENVFSQIFSAFASMYGGSTIVPSADGNVISAGNVVPFALGGLPHGVYNSPQYFPMSGNRTGLMAEAGTEAILPLTRGPGGKLGVHAQGAGGGNVIINIFADEGEKVESRQRRGAGGNDEIDIYIGSAGAKDIARRGPMSQTIETVYGLKRLQG